MSLQQRLTQAETFPYGGHPSRSVARSAISRIRNSLKFIFLCLYPNFVRSDEDDDGDDGNNSDEDDDGDNDNDEVDNGNNDNDEGDDNDDNNSDNDSDDDDNDNDINFDDTATATMATTTTTPSTTTYKCQKAGLMSSGLTNPTCRMFHNLRPFLFVVSDPRMPSTNFLFEMLVIK